MVSGGIVVLSTSTDLSKNQLFIGSSQVTIQPEEDAEIDSIDIGTLDIESELNIKSGSTLTIESGVEINPTSDGGRAGVNKWGFTQLSNLSHAISSCKGDLTDAELPTSLILQEDSNNVISTNVLSNVIKSKTAKPVDLTLPNGDSRKFVTSSSLSSTTLIGFSRVSTKVEVESALNGGVTGINTTQENNPEFVNPYGLYHGLVSSLATDLERQNQTGGLTFINAADSMSITLAGIGKLADNFSAPNIVAGRSTIQNYTTSQWNDHTRLINVYTLDSIIDNNTATTTDRTNGTGDFFIKSNHLMSNTLYGLGNLLGRTELDADTTVYPNSSTVSSSPTLETSPSTLINKRLLDNAFFAKTPTDAQRASIGSQHLLINLSNSTATDKFGISKLENTANIISVLGGDATKPGTTPNNIQKEENSVLNRYGLRAGLFSLFADSVDLTEPIVNGRIIRSDNILSVDTFGISRLETTANILSIIGGDNTKPGTSPTVAQQNENRVLNRYGLRNALNSIYADTNDLTAPIVPGRLIRSDNTATASTLGITKIMTSADVNSLIGGNGGGLVTPISGTLSEDHNTVVNAYKWALAFDSRRASVTERTNGTNEVAYISPTHLATTTLRGVSRLATTADLVTIASNDGSARTASINPSALNAAGLGGDNLMDLNSTVELIRSFRANSTQLSVGFGGSLSPPSGKTTILYVSAEDKATTNVYGITRAHSRFNAFVNHESFNYISVGELLDPNTQNRSIQPPWVRRYDPAGEIIDMGINVANIADPSIFFGFLPCDGGTYNSATYPELANLIAGSYGNPSPIGATFVVPNINSDVPGAPNAKKFIRI